MHLRSLRVEPLPPNVCQESLRPRSASLQASSRARSPAGRTCSVRDGVFEGLGRAPFSVMSRSCQCGCLRLFPDCKHLPRAEGPGQGRPLLSSADRTVRQRGRCRSKGFPRRHKGVRSWLAVDPSPGSSSTTTRKTNCPASPAPAHCLTRSSSGPGSRSPATMANQLTHRQTHGPEPVSYTHLTLPTKRIV